MIPLFLALLPSPLQEPRPHALPEVVVTAPQLNEEKRVGPYGQPAWTLRRRFPSTRVYLQLPPGEMEFEQWAEVRVPKDSDDDTVTRFREEFAFGLGHRTQLDLYLNTEHVRDGVDSTLDFRSLSAEIRYAFANWDEIFGNPTAYFEYHISNDDADKIEPKMLFGGEIAPGWHWGSNWIYERTLQPSERRTEEVKATASLSRTIVDEVFSVGATGAVAYESEHVSGSAGEHSTEVLLGPSLQWVPHPRAHLDLELLFGLTGESKAAKIFVVFGWRF